MHSHSHSHSTRAHKTEYFDDVHSIYSMLDRLAIKHCVFGAVAVAVAAAFLSLSYDILYSVFKQYVRAYCLLHSLLHTLVSPRNLFITFFYCSSSFSSAVVRRVIVSRLLSPSLHCLSLFGPIHFLSQFCYCFNASK